MKEITRNQQKNVLYGYYLGFLVFNIFTGYFLSSITDPVATWYIKLGATLPLLTRLLFTIFRPSYSPAFLILPVLLLGLSFFIKKIPPERMGYILLGAMLLELWLLVLSLWGYCYPFTLLPSTGEM